MFEPIVDNPPPASQSELVTLTLALAYDCARTDIELSCESERDDVDGSLWHDTERVEHDARPLVDRGVRYLELRQLLLRKPGREAIVKILPAPASHTYPRQS